MRDGVREDGEGDAPMPASGSVQEKGGDSCRSQEAEEAVDAIHEEGCGVSAADGRMDKAQAETGAEAGGRGSGSPPKTAKRETKEEKEARRRQRDEERERKRQREEEEREKKRRKKEEAEAKRKAEEEEKEQKRKKREEEKEKKRQQEEEEKARKLKERDEKEKEKARKKQQEEEEKAKKQKEREERLEKKRQEEEEKREEENRVKAANQKAAAFMSRFLGKTKTGTEPIEMPNSQAAGYPAVGPPAAGEPLEGATPGQGESARAGAGPDRRGDAQAVTVTLDEAKGCKAPGDQPGDDSAASTTNTALCSSLAAGPLPRGRRGAQGAQPLFLPPPATIFHNSTVTKVHKPRADLDSMDRELYLHWRCPIPSLSPDEAPEEGEGRGPSAAPAGPSSKQREASDEGTDPQLRCGFGAAAEAQPKPPQPAEGSCGTGALAHGGAGPGTDIPEGPGAKGSSSSSATGVDAVPRKGAIVEEFQHFLRRRSESTRMSRAGEGTLGKEARGDESESLASRARRARNWRLRRLPKQQQPQGRRAGASSSAKPSKAGAENPKGGKPRSSSGAEAEEEEEEQEEEEEDELWCLMGSGSDPGDAEDDVGEGPVVEGGLGPESSKGEARRKGRSAPRVKKLLQFHDNVRPAFYGTHAPMALAAICGRRPFAKEPLLDYEVDSDDEWEDIPEDQGESLSDSEGEEERGDAEAGAADAEEEEEEEDGFVVPDGYLSEDEGVEQGQKGSPGGADVGSTHQGKGEGAVEDADGGGGDAKEGAQGPTRGKAPLSAAASAAAARWQKMQVLEKAVQKALRTGRPVVLSALAPPSPSPSHSSAAAAAAPAGGTSTRCSQGPCFGGVLPGGVSAPPGPEGRSASSAAARAQLEYLETMSIEILSHDVVVRLPPDPQAVEERPPVQGPEKKRHKKQGSPQSQPLPQPLPLPQQAQHSQSQVPLQQVLHGSHLRSGPALPKPLVTRPRSGVLFGSGAGTATPPKRAPLLQPPPTFRASPPANGFGVPPSTPSPGMAGKQQLAALPTAPASIDDAECQLPLPQQQQGGGKPITAFFLKRTQGMGPQEARCSGSGLAAP